MKTLLLSLLFLAGAHAHAKDVTVEMKSISFNPKTVEVIQGDSIVWKNIAYTDHSATSATFDTGMVHPKASSKPIAFNTPGDFPYNCTMHGKAMSGTVHVTAKKP